MPGEASDTGRMPIPSTRPPAFDHVSLHANAGTPPKEKTYIYILFQERKDSRGTPTKEQVGYFSNEDEAMRANFDIPGPSQLSYGGEIVKVALDEIPRFIPVWGPRKMAYEPYSYEMGWIDFRDIPAADDPEWIEFKRLKAKFEPNKIPPQPKPNSNPQPIIRN